MGREVAATAVPDAAATPTAAVTENSTNLRAAPGAEPCGPAMTGEGVGGRRSGAGDGSLEDLAGLAWLPADLDGIVLVHREDRAAVVNAQGWANDV